MSGDDQRRLRLFERLVEAIGEEATDTVFDLLPPAGREGATNEDVVAVRADVGSLRDEMRHRFDEQTHALTAAWRRDLLLISGGQFTALAAAVLAVLTLG